MKRLLLLLLLLGSAGLRADELTKTVQSSLKDLGFYYGETTGVNSPETAAAIKRYQIRNGYEVTGTLTQETLKGLGIGNDNQPLERRDAPLPPVQVTPTPPAPKKNPPVHLRRDDSQRESDRQFLEDEPGPAQPRPDSSRVSPPAPLNPPSAPGSEAYAEVFARTPYASAPPEVQASTFRKAQTLLARSGTYRDPIDGHPGPATEEAILAYQRRVRLPLTGRLDLETLNAMALLPGRSQGPPMRPFTVPPGSRAPTRVLRGVWVY